VPSIVPDRRGWRLTTCGAGTEHGP
jgi:hypothetical protein